MIKVWVRVCLNMVYETMVSHLISLMGRNVEWNKFLVFGRLFFFLSSYKCLLDTYTHAHKNTTHHTPIWRWISLQEITNYFSFDCIKKKVINFFILVKYCRYAVHLTKFTFIDHQSNVIEHWTHSLVEGAVNVSTSK